MLLLVHVILQLINLALLLDCCIVLTQSVASQPRQETSIFRCPQLAHWFVQIWTQPPHKSVLPVICSACWEGNKHRLFFGCFWVWLVNRVLQVRLLICTGAVMVQGKRCTCGEDIIAEFPPALEATSNTWKCLRVVGVSYSFWDFWQLNYYKHRKNAIIFVCC